jgi:hypothetical protein
VYVTYVMHTQYNYAYAGGWESVMVRGMDYLKTDNSVNKKGGKVPAGEPMFDLINVEVWANKDGNACRHVAESPDGYLQKVLARDVKLEKKARLGGKVSGKFKRAASDGKHQTEAAAASSSMKPRPTRAASEASSPTHALNNKHMNVEKRGKYIVVNFLIPGSPSYNFVLYLRRKFDVKPSPSCCDGYVHNSKMARKERSQSTTTPPSPSCVTSSSALPAAAAVEEKEEEEDSGIRSFETLYNHMLTATDEWLNDHVKFIPNVVEGNWIVRRGVGNTPAIIGRKLAQHYYRDEAVNYMEIDIDVGSSKIAKALLGLVQKYAANIVIEFFFLLETKSLNLLPERLLGGVRMHHINLNVLKAEVKAMKKRESELKNAAKKADKRASKSQ